MSQSRDEMEREARQYIGENSGGIWCYRAITAMILHDNGSHTFEHVKARRCYQPLSDKYRQ